MVKEFALEKHKEQTCTEKQYKNKNNNTEQNCDVQNMLVVTRLT